MSPPAFQLKASPIQMHGSHAPGAVVSPQHRALQLLTAFQNNSSTTQAFSAISKALFVAHLRTRINNPSGVDQMALNACGPATAIYLIANNDPELFAQFAIDLYTKGVAYLGSTYVNPWDGLLSRAPGDAEWGTAPANNVADYIVMASMRSDLNPPFAQFEDPSAQFSGITLPGTLKNWLNFSNTFGKIENDTSFTSMAKDFDHFQNTLVPKYNAGQKVVMFINATMVTVGTGKAASKKEDKKNHKKNKDYAKKAQGGSVNHYVAFEGNFSINGTDVTFDVWSWGQIVTLTLSQAEFSKMYYGGIYIQ